MKILVTGGKGQLARCIQEIRTQHKLLFLDKNELNVVNPHQVNTALMRYRPDIILHFASLTRGDECAKNPKKAYKVNVDGTMNVVSEAARLDIPFVYLSTNEVFDGSKKTPYVEDDKPCPISVVGKTKYLGEEIVRIFLKKYYIVRTMWLYSLWSNNFVHAILEKARKIKRVSLTQDEYGSPTNSHDVAVALLKLVETNSYGVYHFVNSGVASRLEFGRRVILSQKDLQNTHILPIALRSFPRLSTPPRFSPLLNTNGAKKGIVLRGWKEALDDFLEKYSLET
jgi:dTDP-4-dehydrorhamnose reductase